MSGALVFAYGSLVSRQSAAATLGEPLDLVAPARLVGWRRRWSTVRDNRAAEKTFAPGPGEEPFRYCVGLNVEPAGREAAVSAEPAVAQAGVNGALLRLTERQLDRLDLREMRYERAEVTAAIDAELRGGEPVITYVAKARHHRPEPPRGAVILASYVRAVEAAFAGLGAEELEIYRATTDPPPVPVVEGVLVEDRIPAGNPRAW